MYTPPEPIDVAALFSPSSRWQSWLEVEAALALAQVELGLVPRQAADEIAAKANLATIGEDALIADIARTQAPVLSLVHTLAAACSEEAGRYVHWGATTQNIILTGQVLQVRRAHVALLSQLASCLDTLSNLADAKAHTVMAGRTNRQHALPITFGFKVAAWIEEFIRFEARLREGEARLFSLIFGGAIGAMQAFGERGPDLTARLGAKLSLNPVLIPSRTSVDHFVEYLLNLIQLGTTCGKVSKELYQLMSEEFGEVSEHLDASVRGSSTLPQKVNPKLAVALIAQSAQLRGYATPTLEAGQPSHEGDAAHNQILYAVLDAVCPLTYSLMHGLTELLGGLRVNEERMARNLELNRGMIAAENVMITLAPVLGRQRAHDVVHDAMHRARHDARPVVEVLAEMDTLKAHLSREVLEQAINPRNYIGQSADLAKAAARAGREAAASVNARIQEQAELRCAGLF